MLNETVGNIFPTHGVEQDDGARRDLVEPVRILVVDDVIGSRFSLVQVASRDDRVVDAVASSADATRLLSRNRYALVIVDERLEAGTGLSFLETLQATWPSVPRALVTEAHSIARQRTSIARADLAFLLTRPWSPEALVKTLRAFFGSAPAHTDPLADRTLLAKGWRRLLAKAEPLEREDVLARGLLAGLNACADREALVALLRREIAGSLGFDRWYLRRQDEAFVVFDAATPLGRQVAGHALPQPVARELLAASPAGAASCHAGRADGRAVIGLRVGRGLADGPLVAAAVGDPRSAARVLALLEAVEGGLEIAYERVALGETRSRAAHRLARRVSDSLRSRLGRLTHAIDGLRSEAAEIGLSAASVERLRSESERMARDVEHLEGEMLGAEIGTSFPPA